MGSDRKSEEKKKSRKRRSSSASEDEGKGKRQRTVEDEDRKSRKSDRKEKSKDKKRSHKHHSDKEKKSKDKHKSKHHKGDRRLLGLEIQELSGDDYFSKNNEFSTWLKEEKDVFFSDLSAESSRKLFSDFVKAWNKQKLESRYYEGIATAPRSAHNWKIKG